MTHRPSAWLDPRSSWLDEPPAVRRSVQRADVLVADEARITPVGVCDPDARVAAAGGALARAGPGDPRAVRREAHQGRAVSGTSTGLSVPSAFISQTLPMALPEYLHLPDGRALGAAYP